MAAWRDKFKKTAEDSSKEKTPAQKLAEVLLCLHVCMHTCKHVHPHTTFMHGTMLSCARVPCDAFTSGAAATRLISVVVAGSKCCSPADRPHLCQREEALGLKAGGKLVVYTSSVAVIMETTSKFVPSCAAPHVWGKGGGRLIPSPNRFRFRFSAGTPVFTRRANPKSLRSAAAAPTPLLPLPLPLLITRSPGAGAIAGALPPARYSSDSGCPLRSVILP